MADIRKNFFRHLVIFCLLLAGFSLFSSCETTPSERIACYCGPLDEPNLRKSCGLWEKLTTHDSRTPELLKTFDDNSCNPQECLTAARNSRRCSTMTFRTGYKFQNDSLEPCYCSQIEHNEQVVCAIWKKGDRVAREYHATKTCDFTMCGSPKFRFSQTYCSEGFISYFTPIEFYLTSKQEN